MCFSRSVRVPVPSHRPTWQAKSMAASDLNFTLLYIGKEKLLVATLKHLTFNYLSMTDITTNKKSSGSGMWPDVTKISLSFSQ